MSELKICRFPDPVLRRVSAPVKHLSANVQKFIDLLIETMNREPGGIGVAAPQVGVLKRIAIVDVSTKVIGARRKVLINPTVLSSQEHHVHREGCMSLPDFTGNVRRALRLQVAYRNRDFEWEEVVASGIEARCIEHEIDHLDGILFVDRVVSLKSDVFPRKRYL